MSKENTTAARKLITDHSQIDLFFTDQLRRWYSSTALFLNRKYNETGQVFLEKTKRVSINTYEKFCSLLCYIHHNPIHHGLSKTYEEWPFSSFQERSEEHTSELQSRGHLVCRLLLEIKNPMY